MGTNILMAPMQIKPHLSIGNLYDLLLCDFYGKYLRMRNDESFFPILFNVNGSPVEKLVSEHNASQDIYYDLATEAINSMLAECKRFFIDYDCVLRDDDNLDVISSILPRMTVQAIRKCPSCNNFYGSDPSIKVCRRCGQILTSIDKNTFAVCVNSNELLNKVSSINFAQPSTKLRLENFIESFPSEYSLILEKARRYTTLSNGIQLDPRYTAISLLSTVRKMSPKGSRIVHMHGDVIKKFTYYVLAYLPDDDLPDVDITHGSIVNSEHEKIRSSSSEASFNFFDFDVSAKELRALFLSSSVMKDLVLDNAIVQGRCKFLVKVYVLSSRICEERNYKPGTHGIRKQLQQYLDLFYTQVEHWNLPKAFNLANSFIHECWKIVKDAQLTEEEVNVVKNLRSIYFGE